MGNVCGSASGREASESPASVAAPLPAGPSAATPAADSRETLKRLASQTFTSENPYHEAETKGNLFLQPEAGLHEEFPPNMVQEDLPKSDALVRNFRGHFFLLPDEYNDPKHVLPDGTLKPRRAPPQTKMSAFLAGLEKVDGVWVHTKAVNEWPAFSGLQFTSITYLEEGQPIEKLERLWNHKKGEEAPPLPEAASITKPCRITVLAPNWMTRGWAPDAPGFVYWYSEMHANVPRILVGQQAVRDLSRDEPTTRDATITMVHAFAHHYPVLPEKMTEFDKYNIHTGLLIEWSHGLFTTIVELAWLNAVSGYAGKANWVEDKLAPETMLYKTMLPSMKMPWNNKFSEIRMYDMAVKNVTEFEAYLHKYSNKQEGLPFSEWRFVDPVVYKSTKPKIEDCNPEALTGYMVNYIQRLPNYGHKGMARNCQTFVADLLGFLTDSDEMPYSKIGHKVYASQKEELAGVQPFLPRED